jgi:D-glycero-D-manno-heptose 1,7-bisphosphate phosphatase
MNNKRKAIFLDKDGTLIPDIPYNVNPDLIFINSDVIEGLKLLKEENFLFIVISNQPGVALGYFEEEQLLNVKRKLEDLLQEHDISLNGFYYCPHLPGTVNKKYAMDCNCRKPLPGLLLKAAGENNIDLTQSWMVGDILNDVEAGKRAGCKTILINNGNETEWTINEFRTPDYSLANMKEAAIKIVQLEKQKNGQHEKRMATL